jgi:uncharacterized protein
MPSPSRVCRVIHVLRSTYLQSAEVVEQTRPAHLQFLKEEIAAGRLLLAGRQDGGSGGMLITADIAVEEADDMIARDPYTKAGVANYERTSFNGALRAPGL